MDDFETAFLNQRDRAQMPNVSVPKQNVYQRPYAHPPQEQGIDYSGGQMDTEFQTRHGVQLTTDMLPFDQNFVAASKGMYNHFEGEPFTGSDQEAAEYGVELMGEFYFNFAGVPATGSQGTLYQATSIIAAGDGKKAQDFIYLMDQYERLPTFGEGAFSRMFRNMLKDPSNWAAAATLGTGKILTAGGQQATKMTARQSLRQLAGQAMVDVTTEVAKRPGTYGAIFEGTRSAAEEQMLTNIERAAGYEVSPLEEGVRTTVAGTIGVAAGGALSKLGETVLGGVAEGAPEAISKAVTDYVGGAEGRMLAREADTSVQLNAGVDVPAAIDETIVGAQKVFQKPTKENPVTAVAPTETEPGIIAFHGSGADFDEFKLEKIGTGIGYQNYGNGLYFSDSIKVAESYKKEPGKVFMVKLGVKEKNLLDWQKPLKEQPVMLNKIRSLIDDEDILQTFDYNVNAGIAAGNAYVNYISGSGQKTSELLKSVGIEGIKYLDIGSRAGGKSISDAPTNYVIFNDKAIKILNKYGIVGPVAITGVAANQQGGSETSETM